MKKSRIIKRYQNRKLYDTESQCYVTIEELSNVIREGGEIIVIDNKTKQDITYMTKIQILYNKEFLKSDDSELLNRAIRTEDGTLTGYIKMLESKIG